MQIPISVVAQDKASEVLKGVESSLGSLSNSLEESSQKTQISFSGIVAAAASIAAAYGTVKAATAVTSEYDKQATAMRGLSDAQVAFTQQVEQSLGIRDTEVAKILKQAAAYGVEASSLQTVTKATIGVANALDINHKQALQKVINAGKDWQQVQDAAIIGLDKQTAIMGTSSGAVIQLQNQFSKLREAVGGLMSPIVDLASRGLSVFASAMTSAATPAINVFMAAVEMAKPVLQQFGDFIGLIGQALGQQVQAMALVVAEGFAAILAAADVTWNSFGEIVSISLNTVELAVIQWSEILKHTFTVEIPAYVKWFAENFFAILRDMAVGAITLIQNLGKNMGEAFFAIFQWIAGGMQGGLGGLMEQLGNGLYVGLLDGFTAQTQSLPDVIKREITAREKELAELIAKQGGDLGAKFAEKFQQNLDALKAALNLSGGINFGGLGDLIGKASTLNQELKATQSRLQVRGRADDPMAQQVDLLRQLNGGINQVVQNTDPARQKPGVQLGVADLA